jgi:predicted dehydrogenase
MPIPLDPSTLSLKPVRIAIVGLRFGDAMGRLIHDELPCYEIAMVCDQLEERANRLAEHTGARAVFDLEDVLSDASIEAVALFTGPKGRAAIASRILSAGKHLLTTKPFELDAVAQERVLRQAQEAGLVVHLNSPAPLPSADIRLIRRWQEEHGMGRIVAMRAETWACYREKADGGWYDDDTACPAAPITRLGIYFLNDFFPLLGEVKRVQVMQTRLFTERPTADNAQISAEFTNGCLANVFASFCINDGEPYRDDVTLNFENGTIRRFVHRTPDRRMHVDHAELSLVRPGHPVERVHLPGGGYAGWYEWEAFVKAVRGDASVPRVMLEETGYGTRLLDAVARSVASGQAEIP